MNKFFFNSDIKKDNVITVTGDTAHHILRVLRMRPGEEAIFCDGACRDFFCKLESSDVKSVIFSVQHEHFCEAELPYKVTLYQGIPTSDKLNMIIQKAVELGVHSIVPVHTQFSHNTKNFNQARLNKISEMAAGQSKRGIIPQVESPIALNKINKSSLWLVAFESEKNLTIQQALQNTLPCDIGIFIGSEGGFAEEEIKMLEDAGASIITLGRRILRTETAGMAAMVQLQCAWNAAAL